MEVQLKIGASTGEVSPSARPLGTELRKQQAIYRALQIIGGHIGLPILLLFSIFSKTAQRDLTFLNFCFTWIFSSITFSLGLYRLGPASSFFGITLPFIHSDQECLTQAALVCGAQVMTDTAMCALIVQLWFDFRAVIHGPRSPRQIRWTRAMVDLIWHHLSLVFKRPFFTTTASSSALRAARLIAVPTSFYCMLFDDPIMFLISQYTVLLAILFATLIFDACIIHILYRRWWFVQRTGGKALGVPLSVAFRVVIFCAYRLVVAVAYVAAMLNTQGITVLSGPNGLNGIFPFIPVWVDMLQGGSAFRPPSCYSDPYEYSRAPSEFRDAFMFWRWFNLDTLMFRCRRSPVTLRASNAHGEVFDDESVVSGD
ncbi:hypothetical protein JB92DRAFT_3026528, partial [Gautieria morchelliformis]